VVWSDKVTTELRELVIEAGRGERQYLGDLWRYRELLWILAWRDVVMRYRPTAIGVVWALIRPRLTIVVFTIVFAKLAKMPSEKALQSTRPKVARRIPTARSRYDDGMRDRLWVNSDELRAIDPVRQSRLASPVASSKALTEGYRTWLPLVHEFVSEQVCVGKAACIEYPAILHEYLYNFDVHLSFVKVHDGVLVYLPKCETALETACCPENSLSLARAAVLAADRLLVDQISEDFEWRGTLPCRRASSLKELTRDVSSLLPNPIRVSKPRRSLVIRAGSAAGARLRYRAAEANVRSKAG
jgi:hypothetical protein